MKKLTLVVFVGVCALGSSALARDGHSVRAELTKAPVVLAAIQAAHIFESDFEKTLGREVTNEFVGFHAQASAGEVEVGIFNLIASGQTAKDLYGCHFHEDAGSAVEAHCHNEGQQEILTYSASPRSFSVEEFETSAVEAVELFGKRVGSPSLIEKAKFWRNGDEIQVSMRWTPAGQSEQASYFVCDYHGSHMDCHKQSRPGPNEPLD